MNTDIVLIVGYLSSGALLALLALLIVCCTGRSLPFWPRGERSSKEWSASLRSRTGAAFYGVLHLSENDVEILAAKKRRMRECIIETYYADYFSDESILKRAALIEDLRNYYTQILRNADDSKWVLPGNRDEHAITETASHFATGDFVSLLKDMENHLVFPNRNSC